MTQMINVIQEASEQHYLTSNERLFHTGVFTVVPILSYLPVFPRKAVQPQGLELGSALEVYVTGEAQVG